MIRLNLPAWYREKGVGSGPYFLRAKLRPRELVPYADFDTINGVSIGLLDAADGIFFI